MDSVIQSKLLRHVAVMPEKLNKKLVDRKRLYKDFHDRCIRTKSSLRPGQWVFVDHPPPVVAAADSLTTDTYSKLIPRKLGPHGVLLMTTETVTIDEEEMPSTITSDRALLALKSKIAHLQRAQALSTRPNMRKGHLKDSLRLTRTVTSVTLSDGRLQVSIETLTKRNTMQLATTQNMIRKARKPTINIRSNKLSAMWARPICAVCFVMVLL